MPIEVRGLKGALKALKNLEPDVEKNLNKEVRAFAAPVVTKSKGFVDSNAGGLTNWKVAGSAKKFKESQSIIRKGFPKFNASTVKAGIRFSTQPTKRNPRGFVSIYRIVNSNPAGAIYEWAGRTNANKGKSARPNFAAALSGMQGEGKLRGRVIFKAWDEDKGRAANNVIKAVNLTLMKFGKTVKNG